MSNLTPASDADLQVGLPTWRWGRDLCAPFVQQLPVSGASICVIGAGGHQSTVCTSDVMTEKLDQLQFDLGEGPRWEVMRTGSAVLCPDVRADAHPHWPVFGAAAGALGVGALFAFPIMMGAVRLGVVDLYRTEAGGLDRDTRRRAIVLARMVAARAVSDAVRTADHPDAVPEQASAALRREVHQATGMILIQLNTTATDAFALLRSYAFTTNRTVAALAHDVVTGLIDFRQVFAE